MWASLGGTDWSGASTDYVGPYNSSYYTPYQALNTDTSSGANSPWANAWGNYGGAAIGAVGNYLSNLQQQKNNAEMMKLDAKLQIELAQKKRDYQLEDRKYSQQAIGKWAKYFGGS